MYTMIFYNVWALGFIADKKSRSYFIIFFSFQKSFVVLLWLVDFTVS